MPNDTNLHAVQARLDACLAAVASVQTNLNRIGSVPTPAEYALDDLDDLIVMVRAKLYRAAAAIDDAVEAANNSREEYPDHGPTDPWRTSGPGGSAA